MPEKVLTHDSRASVRGGCANSGSSDLSRSSSTTGPFGSAGRSNAPTLAILLLNVNRVVSVERLADALYAGAPPVTAVTQVQRQMSDLRRLLGADAIETRAPGYVLRVDPERLDLGRFERLTQDAAQALERNERQAAVDLLRRALELWRGTPLAD